MDRLEPHYVSVHHVCASTVEASEPVFRHISRVCGMASSVRIDVFRTASSLCNLVNEVVQEALIDFISLQRCQGAECSIPWDVFGNHEGDEFDI